MQEITTWCPASALGVGFFFKKHSYREECFTPERKQTLFSFQVSEDRSA